MWIFSRENLKFLAVNDAAIAVYGYSREEFLELTIADIRPEADRAALIESTLMDGGGLREAGTWRHILKSGQIIFVNIRSHDVEFENQRARMVITHDVTLLIQEQSERSKLVARQKELQERLSDTLESLSDGFLTLDSDLTVTYVNLEAEKILDRERSTLVGQSLRDAYPEISERKFETEYRRALETQEVVRFSDYYPPLAKWFEVHAHPVPDGLAIYFRDVTEQRAKDEQLRLLEKAVAHLNDVLIITQAEPLEEPAGPMVVFTNDAFSKQTGFNREELLGRTPRMLQGPATQRDRLDAMRRSMEAWQPYRTELINYTKSGKEIWIDIEILPVADETGCVTHWVSVQRDITERVHADAVLKLNNARFETIAKAVKDVVWEWDLSDDRLWWSEAMLSQFGHSRDPERNTIDSWKDNIHPEDRQRVVLKIEDVVGGPDDNWDDDYRFARADGSYAVVVDRGYVIRDDTGKGIRMIGTMMDITERRELEMRLGHAQKLEALGQLTGGIAHDFNNLLTVIVGNSEILAGQLPADTDLRALAELTYAAAERGAELTRRLLAFGRRQPLELRLVDVGSLIQSIESLLKRTLPENIRLQIIPPRDPCFAQLDAGQLEAAMLNLIINARDAMPSGGSLIVRSEKIQLLEALVGAEVLTGSYVKLSVEDTGHGMDDEVLSRAFEPFFTTKDVGEGSGLGLSMVYGFVTQSSGNISVTTSQGTGTAIEMFFPSAQGNIGSELLGRKRGIQSGNGEKILVVEDDEMVRVHVTSQLSNLGYRILSATDGQQALKLIRQHADIKLIFTDVVMPGGINGAQLAKKARKIRPGIRILFTSGYTSDSKISNAVDDKPSLVLTKPYRLRDLAQKVRVAID